MGLLYFAMQCMSPEEGVILSLFDFFGLKLLVSSGLVAAWGFSLLASFGALNCYYLTGHGINFLSRLAQAFLRTLPRTLLRPRRRRHQHFPAIRGGCAGAALLLFPVAP